jgi:hypothetical protein
MTDKQHQRPENGEGTPKPDTETLHTTDPQEHMDGPVSSGIQKAGDVFDSGESKEEADEEREKSF